MGWIGSSNYQLIISVIVLPYGVGCLISSQECPVHHSESGRGILDCLAGKFNNHLNCEQQRKRQADRVEGLQLSGRTWYWLHRVRNQRRLGFHLDTEKRQSSESNVRLDLTQHSLALIVSVVCVGVCV